MAASKRQEIYSAIDSERDFQVQKHKDEQHSMGAWLLLIESELNEAKLASVKGGSGRNSIRSELIQVSALCVAALEQHGLHSDNNGREV